MPSILPQPTDIAGRAAAASHPYAAVVASALEVSIRGHWLNGWFLYLLSTPVVVIDGERHPAAWRRPVRIPVDGGKHTIAVGARYRGTPWLLGVRERAYVVPEDGTLSLSAMNGPLNSEPFNVEISRRATSATTGGN